MRDMQPDVLVQFQQALEISLNKFCGLFHIGCETCIFNPKKKTRPKPIAGSVPSFNSFSNECRFHSRCGISRKICSEISPELVEIEPGHLVACHACGGVRDD